MRHIIFPTLAVLNNLPNYASNDDEDTYVSVLHMMCIASLILIGSIFIGRMPKKYWPPILDCTFSLVRYFASGCMIKIILGFNILLLR